MYRQPTMDLIEFNPIQKRYQSCFTENANNIKNTWKGIEQIYISTMPSLLMEIRNQLPIH